MNLSETSSESPVRELRLALTSDDYDGALRFYRDVLGLPVVSSWERDTGSGAILDAGRATLELLSPKQAEQIDEIEVGRSGVSGPVRIALRVADSVELAARLAAAGAEQLAEPVVTPWSDRNVRLRTPEGIQLTLFTPLESDTS
ncbi:MAG: VOC family protein [Actinobacteria bacterium]|nr:MAG: VOC family protein [Actinomycetota bacterium]